ncbi:hypothetical protein BLOT_001999 [Blomia tropicalis]|nr:hypothetical protein BLOT_001999 [Blomia tropicalis]
MSKSNPPKVKETNTTNAGKSGSTKPNANVKEIRLKPEGEVHTISGKYDCCAFVIHCAEHQRILTSKQEQARWLPFTQMMPNRSWKDGALIGFCVVLGGSDPTKFNALKATPPYETFKCMQIKRIQMPQTRKFITRHIYYFKLKPNTPGFQCCQVISPNLEWAQLTDVSWGRLKHVWGPELLEFGKLAAGTFRQRISEFGLDEAFLFVPRDPPRNLEEGMLRSLQITEKDVERLYGDFVEHCFPSSHQTLHSFKCYIAKYGFEQDEDRLEKLFEAFNIANNGYLSFHELLLGLACMEPSIQHGEFRVKFIFRYYDSDRSGTLSVLELKNLVSDMTTPDKVESKMTEATSAFRTTAIKGKQEISAMDFVVAIGSHKFRGTSTLCRSSKPIFAQILRAFAAKNIHQVMGCKNQLGKLMIKRKAGEVCPTCKDKKYEIATHRIEIDINGIHKSKVVAPIEPVEANATVQTAQQYSLECVFKPISVANIMLRLVREFNAVKGTAVKPKGLMQERKGDFWKLCLLLYQDLDILLENEVKCQKVYSPCYVIGDIHGNLEDLLTMEKTLWKQMPVVGANFLFLGDYVDRGQWGLECTLYLMAFKILCPNKVTMLRGNHEVRSLQKHYTYQKECILKYGELIGLKVWELTNKVYDKLPVCGLVDEAIFCAHGGIPHEAKTIDQIIGVKRVIREPEQESLIAWEILWSDPAHMQQYLDVCEMREVDPDEQKGFVYNTKRGTAYMFNENGAATFLRSNFLTHIIRAHEVAPPGYVFHFTKTCVTIFSCSHYCGNDNDCGLILCDNQKLRVVHLDTANNAAATD